ncbi:hypothetical protein J8F10_26430 [Gemmata sp. G18]|uniref:Restriction endonuclease domain-containing protein n=1 Tax=Gemmata palustris TaxID=2822762 RepID=A0ABS5C0Z4_9BACT|nr:hypothetical protein [Gemmata palustris]MBP3958798.1 hypothetical protein [Gemmata palustris]
MSTDVTATNAAYPDSDGKPMADNTLQWDWMVKIVGELRELFAGQQVFVAGDLLWYPVQGDPKTRQEWESDGFAPQVVFWVRSTLRTVSVLREETTEMLRFCEQQKVEELYCIEAHRNRVVALVRNDGRMKVVYPLEGYISPRLGVRFGEDFSQGLFDWEPDLVVTTT